MVLFHIFFIQILQMLTKLSAFSIKVLGRNNPLFIEILETDEELKKLSWKYHVTNLIEINSICTENEIDNFIIFNFLFV